jgi:hypothetical protein
MIAGDAGRFILRVVWRWAMRTGVLLLLAASPGLLALGAVAISPGLDAALREYRAAAQEPRPDPGAADALTLEQRMQLRCSAAFALVADRQTRGEEQALRYPPVAERGREFFVRSSAQVMEESGLDRPGINAALTREALDLVEAGTLDAIMPVCLQALQDAGL